MINDIDIQAIVKHFKNNKTFTTNDVYDFYAIKKPGIKRTTVNWHICNLIHQGIILRLGRGVYAVGKEKGFTHIFDSKQKKIARDLIKKFPYTTYCCWNISVLGEFFQHLPKISFIIIEVENNSLEAAFYFLKESYKNVFKTPSKEIIEDFITDKDWAIIIKPLISESPLIKAGGIFAPALEKILVDILAEKEIFYFLQGNELFNIYKNASGKYSVNFSRLMRYAKRRGKGTEVSEVIKQITGNNQ